MIPQFDSAAAGEFDALSGTRVTLCVTGSIAAYKTVMLTRLLLKAGASVQVVLTKSAEKFVGAATFAGLTGSPVLRTMFDDEIGGELHVELGAQSDLIAIVPTTADCLARLAMGRADDLVTATALSARCPIVLAPAMHPTMWGHPATERNVATLIRDDRVIFAGPTSGEVASGDVGDGRMLEPEQIASVMTRALTDKDLEGQHLVVTAGPTVEDIDPVRFLTNRSTGKMGFAIAIRARQRGAQVTLISGPVELATPDNVKRIDVRSAVEMQSALDDALGPKLERADVLIMSAAVGDYRSARTHSEKVKRSDEFVSLPLVQNPDLLAELGARRTEGGPLLVGFAVETGSDEQIVSYARGKLDKKKVDLVVANHASDGFGGNSNRVLFVNSQSHTLIEHAPKSAIAEELLDWCAGRLNSRPASQKA
ncbi:MAG: bifunctional phosphopantothenoylcysteine decarboxylase/phosphopantothenate--cysteine ligase CoaBC [Polyangiaceae bacterium]|nr:bifunctional phosphopantothenoylcysteine decarboxylase/phosphopantothenate--cysteine ligase CoaBC [Polyangiaceae bacterium]